MTFGLSITFVIAGFLAGMYLVYRFVPPLAATREGVIASWVVRAFVGAAFGWTAFHLYLGIYAFVNYADNNNGVFPLPNGSRTEILLAVMQPIFSLGGLLIAAATIIYLLAPVGEADAGG